MNKKNFVEFELSKMLRACNTDVRCCTYDKDLNGEEIVTVHMTNSAKYCINVTADSLICVVADVVNVMKGK